MTTADATPAAEKAKRHRRTLEELRAAQAPLSLEQMTAKIVEMVKKLEGAEQRRVIEAAQVLLGHT